MARCRRAVPAARVFPGRAGRWRARPAAGCPAPGESRTGPGSPGARRGRRRRPGRSACRRRPADPGLPAARDARKRSPLRSRRRRAWPAAGSLYVVAHPLQGLVQGEVLFLGTMPAVIRRQADGAEPRQGTAGQAGRSADAGQGTGDSRRSRRLARGDGARGILRSPRGGAGEGREQGAEGRLAVFAATDHLYLVLFGDPRPMMPTRLSTLATCPAKCSSAWLEKPCAVFRSSAAGRACRPP